MKDVVRTGYNSVATKYLAERHYLRSTKYIHKLLKLLKLHSSVLDIGCGAGIPVDDMFLVAGHSVTGLDISPEMIKHAKHNCPSGTYIVRDAATILLNEFTVDAVVSFYTLFHLPRHTHGEIIRKIASYLPHGGYLLITMGEKDFEGTTDFYGVPMWWSQWGPEKNRELVERAGFNLLIDELDHTGSENHHIILAQKN